MEFLHRLPRACDASALAGDPFAYLRQAETLGNLVVLREDGPIFSRRPDCPVALAVFGGEAVRQVLAAGDSFVMPPSAADRLGLPERLKNLNHGLHSMTGTRHRRQKALLSSALAGADLFLSDEDIARLLEAGLDRVGDGRLPLLGFLRALLETAAATMLFGPAEGRRGTLATALADYFRRRRSASSPLGDPGSADREGLVGAGEGLDERLRRIVNGSRGGLEVGGLVGGLAGAHHDGERAFSDDEIVAHANVLFMSMTEPVAVALTWLFLLLSQQPSRYAELRRGVPLEWLVAETLRLLTPNAIMVRSARAGAKLCGVALPDGAELVVSPLVAHRDPVVFPDPDRFDPGRWRSARPGPFDYMPFGAGLHVCIGQVLAKRMIRSIALGIIDRYDLILASSEPIDWQIDIMLKPRDEVYFNRLPAAVGQLARVEEWRGPSRELVDL